MTTSDWVWLALALAVGGWETRGILRHKRGKEGRDTISQYVWAVGDVKYHRIPVGKGVIAVALAWLAFHFLAH